MSNSPVLCLPTINRERTAAFLAQFSCGSSAEARNFRAQFLAELAKRENEAPTEIPQDHRFVDAYAALVHEWDLLPPEGLPGGHGYTTLYHQGYIAALHSPKLVYDYLTRPRPLSAAERSAENSIPRYVANWCSSYRDIVGTVADRIGSLGEQLELSINIPVAETQEVAKIPRCLDCIRRLDISPDVFRAVFLVNYPTNVSASQRSEVDRCIEVIDRFQRSFPHFAVRAVLVERSQQRS